MNIEIVTVGLNDSDSAKFKQGMQNEIAKRYPQATRPGMEHCRDQDHVEEMREAGYWSECARNFGRCGCCYMTS